MILILAGIGAAAFALLAAGRFMKGRSPAPAEGAAAPGFTLQSQNGRQVGLQDLRGRWIVLYFYPKDFTGGCTIEARGFQRDLAQYEKRNAVILGVSTQDEKTHQSFCTKEGLGFQLLADTQGIVSRQYGSLLDFGVAKLSIRRTFLIDPHGVIRKVWLSVDFNKHSADVLAMLDDLQQA